MQNQIVKANANTNSNALISNQTQNQFVYKYGVSLIDKHTDTCPIEVFGNGNYINSAPRVIGSIEKRIEEFEQKLNLMDEDKVNEYVEQHFDEEYNREKALYEQELKKYDELDEEYRVKFAEEIEEETKELRSQLSTLDFNVADRLKQEYYEINKLNPNDELNIHKEIMDLMRSKSNISNQLEEFKQYMLDQAKEEEKQRLVRYVALPHSKTDVIRNVNEFINERVETNYIENLDGFFGEFEHLFPNVQSESCKKTLRDMFDKGWSKDLKEVHQAHNQEIVNKLSYITSIAVENATLSGKEGPSLEKLENDLKESFERFINNQYMTIFNGVFEFLSKIKKSTQSFSSETAIKTYAREKMSDITKTLKAALPELLNRRFNDFLLDLMDEWKIGESEEEAEDEPSPKAHVIIRKVSAAIEQKLEITFNEFLNLIPDEELEVNDLTKRYNAYFGKSYTARGFGMMKEIKDNFTKHRTEVNGKKITVYKKIVSPSS